MKKIAILISTSLLLSGCSLFKDTDSELMEQGDASKVFDSRLGPDTKELLKGLPNTLVGDKKNARHSGTSKKPEGNN